MALKLIPPGKRKNRHYYVRGTLHGRHIEESTETTNPVEAARYKASLELRLLDEAQAVAGQATFAHAAEQFIAFRKPRKEDERAIRRLFPFIGHKPVGQVKHPDLVASANAIYPMAMPQTKNRRVMGPAARVLHYAAENEWCAWLRVRLFKEPRAKTRAVSKDTAERLIAAAPPGPRRFLLLWLFSTGMRLGDTLRLRWSDVDPTHGMVRYHVGKTDRYVEKRLHPILLAHPRGKPASYIFPWRHASGVYWWLWPLVRSLGVTFTPHMARHSLGKWLNESGASLRTIMDQLDHLSPASSVRYQSTDQDVLAEAVAKAVNVGKRSGNDA